MFELYESILILSLSIHSTHTTRRTFINTSSSVGQRGRCVGVAQAEKKRERERRSDADSENYSRATTTSILVAIKCDNSIQTIKQFSQNVETARQSERATERGREGEAACTR